MQKMLSERLTAILKLALQYANWRDQAVGDLRIVYQYRLTELVEEVEWIQQLSELTGETVVELPKELIAVIGAKYASPRS